MARPKDASVRFPCPRCFTRLRAPSAQAGTKRRCPRCQRVFEVPKKSRAVGPHEEYAVSEGRGPSLAEGRYIAATCPVCDTRMYATEDQAGQELACPDCGTLVVVPPPAEVEDLQQQQPPAAEFDEYALSEEVDAAGPSPGLRPADQRYVPVTCPLCNTLMKVTEDRVGEQIVCPDCHTTAIVPPPEEVPAAPKGPAYREPAEYGEYAVSEEVSDSGLRAADRKYIAVVCPCCDTRLHATTDQVGQEIVCPDCDESIVVPPPPPPAHRRGMFHVPPMGGKPDPRAEGVGEYGVRDAVDVAQYEPLIRNPSWRSRPAATDDSGAPVVLTPPRWPFFSGVFQFPFYPQTWRRWIGLSIGLAVVLGLVTIAVGLGSQGGGLDLFRMLMLFAVSGSLGLIWTMVTSVSLLAVLIDTAYGCDEVEHWPDALFVDWLIDSFFVVNGVLLSVLPVAGVTYVWGHDEPLPGPYLAASVVLLFPIILLSMLERDSPLNPLSPPTWRTFLTAWRAWGLFYLETAVLLVAAGGLIWQAWVFAPPWMAVVAAPAVLVAVLMIYFRLLGRLAWCCARAAPAEPRHVEQAASDEAAEE